MRKQKLDPEDCPKCGGHGTKIDPTNPDAVDGIITCPTCKGYGKQPESEPENMTTATVESTPATTNATPPAAEPEQAPSSKSKAKAPAAPAASTAASKFSGLLLDPKELTIITDPKHFLYDERVKLPLDEGLVRNILQFGVKDPIHVKKDGDTYLVVDGRQRVKAAIEASKRAVKAGGEPIRVPVVTEKGNEADLTGVMILTNELRQNDGPMIKAAKLQRYLAMGKSQAEAAVTFGVSEQTVRNWQTLLTCTAKVRKAVESGKIQPTAAYKLAALAADKQDEALEELLNGEGKATVRKAERSAAKKKGANANQSNDNRPSRAKIEALRELLAAIDKEVLKKAEVEAEVGSVIDVLNWVLDGTSCEMIEEAFTAKG